MIRINMLTYQPIAERSEYMKGLTSKIELLNESSASLSSIVFSRQDLNRFYACVFQKPTCYILENQACGTCLKWTDNLNNAILSLKQACFMANMFCLSLFNLNMFWCDCEHSISVTNSGLLVIISVPPLTKRWI